MRSLAENQDVAGLHKMPTGVEGFDAITGGGLPRNRTSLILGGPGGGKTVFALQTLVNGARHFGEPGIFGFVRLCRIRLCRSWIEICLLGVHGSSSAHKCNGFTYCNNFEFSSSWLCSERQNAFEVATHGWHKPQTIGPALSLSCSVRAFADSVLCRCSWPWALLLKASSFFLGALHRRGRHLAGFRPGR